MTDNKPFDADMKEFERHLLAEEAAQEGRTDATNESNKTTTTPIAGDDDTHELTWAEIAELQQKEFDLRLEVDLPEDHFISVYTNWMQTVTDGYTDYAIACALWILSAIATPKTVLKLRQGRVHPNLWMANLGKSTTSRKSTIINKTRGIFETATETSLPNEEYSLEGYLETLSLNPIMHNVRDEMAGLMAKHHKKYNDGIFDLECVIYDCEGVQKTLASGRNAQPKTFSVKNPRVTKLYATTLSNYSLYMNIDDFTCGYGVRFLFTAPQYKHDRQALSIETEEDVSLWGNILMRIKILWKHFDDIDEEVTFTATQEAMDHFDEVCQTLEEQSDKMNNDMLNTVIGRSEAHILKIAMLLEIGKPEVSNVIGIEMMRVACDMVTGYFIPCIMCVIERLEDDDKNNRIEKILSILRRLGGSATHTKLLRDSHLTSREFNEAVDTMIESKAIAVVTNAESKARVYRLLSHNGKFVFHRTHKVRRVRTYTDHTHNAANFANFATNDSGQPPSHHATAMLHSIGTCELCELCEPCEDSPSAGKCGKCGHELSGQTFQGPAGLGLICADCQAKVDRTSGLGELTDTHLVTMIKDAIFKLGYVRSIHEFTPVHVLMEIPKGTCATTETVEQFMVDHTGDLKIERSGDMWRQVSA